MKDGRKERTACQEEMEPNLEMTQSIVKRQVVPTEHAAVVTGKAPKKQYRVWHLAAGRRGKPKEMTRGNCGSQRKLAAACRKMTCCAGVAQHKGNVRKIQTQGKCGSWKELAATGRMMTWQPGVAQRKGQGQDNVVQETQKGRTFRKRRWEKPEGRLGIRDQDFEEKLRLGSNRTFGGIYRKTIRLEFVKRTARSSARLQRIKDWTLWRSRILPKQLKSLLTYLA